MLAGGGDGLDYLVSFGVCEGERHDGGGGENGCPQDFLDFAPAGFLVAGENEVALLDLFDGLEGDSCRGVGCGKGETRQRSIIVAENIEYEFRLIGRNDLIIRVGQHSKYA